MQKIDKALQKLSSQERRSIKALLLLIQAGELQSFDLRKLTGHNDIYRVRKGDWRIIFKRTHQAISILAIERRSQRTYKNVRG